MLVLDTDELPCGERIDAFQAVASGEVGLVSVVEAEPEATAWKRLEAWGFGPLTMFATRGSGMHIERTLRQARRDYVDTVAVITQSRGTGAFGWREHQRFIGAEGLGLVHMPAGYEYGWSGTGLSVAFTADSERLGLPEQMVRDAIPLIHHSPLEALLLHHIRTLHSHADRLSTGPEAEPLASATLELTRALIVSVAGDAHTRREVAQDTLLTRVLAYTRAHLTHPDLTPARIAHAHSISVRSLYRLCEEGGLSLEQWIIRKRLEGARRDLSAPGQAHRTIEAVARSWGFTNPAYFSRRFHESYGTTPSQWRRLAVASRPPSGDGGRDGAAGSQSSSRPG